MHHDGHQVDINHQESTGIKWNQRFNVATPKMLRHFH